MSLALCCNSGTVPENFKPCCKWSQTNTFHNKNKESDRLLAATSWQLNIRVHFTLNNFGLKLRLFSISIDNCLRKLRNYCFKYYITSAYNVFHQVNDMLLVWKIYVKTRTVLDRNEKNVGSTDKVILTFYWKTEWAVCEWDRKVKLKLNFIH